MLPFFAMAEKNDLFRAQLGFQRRCDEITHYLSKRYVMLNPGRTEMDFITGACDDIRAGDDGSTDDPRALLDLLLKSNDPAVPLGEIQFDPMFPLVLSATYLLRAMSASADGQDERGWNYLADAAYWCGLAQAGRHANLVYASAKDDIASQRGRQGAQGLYGDNYESVVRYAQDLSRKKRPQRGWVSRNEAVKVIIGDVSAFSEKNWKKLTEEQAPKTIHGWLCRMPDAASFFSEGKARRLRKE